MGITLVLFSGYFQQLNNQNLKQLTMKKLAFSIVFFYFFLLGYGQSSECAFLLTDGIRNYIKTNSYEKDYDLVRSEVCRAYNSYKSSGNTASASAKYKLIFKGKASYSKSEIEAIGEASCNHSLNVSDYVSNKSQYSEIIDPNWAKVVETCIINSANGVKYEIEQSNDGYLGELEITVTYVGPDKSLAPTVTSISANPAYLVTMGELEVGKVLNRAYSMKVTRKRMDATEPQIVAGKEVLLPSTIFKIGVSTGQDLNIVYPVVPYEKPIEITYGVGEIVASMLNKETFLTKHNKDGQIWMLAEGNEVPKGTSFRKYLDENFPDKNGICPDLRGVFLRGKNYDRDTTSGNADGDLPLGKYQPDAFRIHNHGYSDWHANLPAGIHSGPVKPNPGHNTDVPRTTGNAGGNETRSRNVTVNYFIRID